jgi:tRNA dimethylallyltransferase
LTPRVLALVGPTAAGKSDLAIRNAPKISAEIVSIDSAVVYKGMDIGTDKPSPDQLAAVPHHMVDVIEPSTTLTVAEFRRMARLAIDDIAARGKTPLLVGGSGLYFRAVVDPLDFPPSDPKARLRVETEVDSLYETLTRLDPEAARRIDPNNTRRLTRALEVIEITGRPFSSFRTGWDDYRSIYDLLVAGLTWPREELDRRINGRVDDQIMRGLVEEVKVLLSRGLRESLTSGQALGYSQILEHLEGTLTLEEAVDRIKRRTRRYARRQLTWFRADPRVVWFESDPDGVARFLKERGVRGE